MRKMYKVLAAMMVAVMMVTVVFATAAFAEESAPTEASQPAEEVGVFDADGQYDGTTMSGEHKFKWFKDRKILFYYDATTVYEIGPLNDQLVFGKLEDDLETFKWSVVLDADPETLAEFGEYMYNLFVVPINRYDSYFESSTQ